MGGEFAPAALLANAQASPRTHLGWLGLARVALAACAIRAEGRAASGQGVRGRRCSARREEALARLRSPCTSRPGSRHAPPPAPPAFASELGPASSPAALAAARFSVAASPPPKKLAMLFCFPPLPASLILGARGTKAALRGKGGRPRCSSAREERSKETLTKTLTRAPWSIHGPTHTAQPAGTHALATARVRARRQHFQRPRTQAGLTAACRRL